MSRIVRSPGIIASNLKCIDKAHLVASVDIAVPLWGLLFKNCLWHRWDNGTEKIFFASASWTDDAGQRHFANIVEFTDEHVRARFQRAAIDAVHHIANPSLGARRQPARRGRGAGFRVPRSSPPTGGGYVSSSFL